MGSLLIGQFQVFPMQIVSKTRQQSCIGSIEIPLSLYWDKKYQIVTNIVIDPMDQVRTIGKV